jgi:hypothetical protein
MTAAGLGDGLVELVLAAPRQRDGGALFDGLGRERPADAGRATDHQYAAPFERGHHLPPAVVAG